jgi:DegV family protein with EDD domain
MKKIAIVTDTDSSLPDSLADEYGIRLVPITIHFGEEVYTTGVDIDDASLFTMVDRRNQLPTTSAPSPSAFTAAFESAFKNGVDAIICICVSSKVSSTYNSALSACESFPGRDITVIDSLNLSMAQGFLAIAAAEAAQKGTSKEEIVALIADMGSRIHFYGVLATLKYLALSGRVGKLAAGMGDTLNIKPILTVREGKLEMLEKVRTRKKALERMFEITRQSLNGKPIERLAILHVNDYEGALDLKEQLCNKVACPATIITAEFTPGLSVHAGSGVVGFVYLIGK